MDERELPVVVPVEHGGGGRAERPVDLVELLLVAPGRGDEHAAAVLRVAPPFDEAAPFQAVQQGGHRGRAHPGHLGDASGGEAGFPRGHVQALEVGRVQLEALGDGPVEHQREAGLQPQQVADRGEQIATA